MASSLAHSRPSPPGVPTPSTARGRRVPTLPRIGAPPRPPPPAPSALAAAAPPPPSWIPYLSLGAGTYCAALAALMTFAPDARVTRALAGVAPSSSSSTSTPCRPCFTTDAALLPPALAYLALLAASWTPDTVAVLLPGSLAEGLTRAGWAPQFFPRLGGVAALFARPATAASLAVHLAAVGLLAARSAYMGGLKRRDDEAATVGGAPAGGRQRGPAVRRLLQGPIILLLAFVGPLGLAVQAIVESGRRWVGGRRAEG